MCVLKEFLLMLLLCGGFVPFNISTQHKQLLLHRVGVVLALKDSLLCCIVMIHVA